MPAANSAAGILHFNSSLLSRRENFTSSEAHFLFDLAEGTDGMVNVFLGVAGGDLGADAVLALGDNGVAEGHHIDTLFQHPAGELMGA